MGKSIFTEFVTLSQASELSGLSNTELGQMATEGFLSVYVRLTSHDDLSISIIEYGEEVSPERGRFPFALHGNKKLIIEDVAKIFRDGKASIYQTDDMEHDTVFKKSIVINLLAIRFKRADILALTTPEESSQPKPATSPDKELSERSEHRHLCIIGALVTLLAELEAKEGKALYRKPILRGGEISASAVKDIINGRFPDDGAQLKRSNSTITEALKAIKEHEQLPEKE